MNAGCAGKTVRSIEKAYWAIFIEGV